MSVISLTTQDIPALASAHCLLLSRGLLPCSIYFQGPLGTNMVSGQRRHYIVTHLSQHTQTDGDKGSASLLMFPLSLVFPSGREKPL